MYTQVEKTKENKSKAVANSVTQKKSSVNQGLGFVDNRPEAIVQRKLQDIANDTVKPREFKGEHATTSRGWRADVCEAESGLDTIQRKIEYGDRGTNTMAEMTVPSGTSLYHATKPNYIPQIASGIDVNKSNTTQLGKGFYTSWFNTSMEKYGPYAVRFKLSKEIAGQQVFSDKIREANKAEKEFSDSDQMEASKAVKGNWDKDNDFLYTPKLDETVDGQDVPHQVKITAKGVSALPLPPTVIETATGTEKSLDEFSEKPERPSMGGLFADIRGKKKKE